MLLHNIVEYLTLNVYPKMESTTLKPLTMYNNNLTMSTYAYSKYRHNYTVHMYMDTFTILFHI
jgi:hypothetical protein